MKYEYEMHDCEICHTEVSIYGTKGQKLEPRQYNRKKCCNSHQCRYASRHPSMLIEIIPKPCKNQCGEDVPLTWPRGEKKTAQQYDICDYCSKACQYDGMFGVDRRGPRGIPTRDTPIDRFIYAL